MNNVIVTNHDFFGSLWLVGWLFTIGFLRLSFWRGVLAIIIWPYNLGVTARKMKGVEHHDHGTHQN